MSALPVTYYRVTCDHPGCDTDTGDLADYSAWSDQADAIDHWRDCDGLVLDDGRTFCPAHRAEHVCVECDEPRDGLAEVDGELVCHRHPGHPDVDPTDADLASAGLLGVAQ